MRISALKASIAVLAVLAAALVIAACGGVAAAAQAKSGGTLKVLDTAGGIDSLDPGYWYYQTDYQELGRHDPARSSTAGSRTETTPTPGPRDGAAEGLERRQDAHDHDQGQASSTARRSRTARSSRRTSSTAIERCFLPAGRQRLRRTSYYNDIKGVGRLQERQGEGHLGDRDARRHDARHQHDDAGRRADKRRRRSACRAPSPVPKDYAQKYDQGKQSTYGQHQVFTGAHT